MRSLSATAHVTAVLLTLGVASASGQTPDEFYSGKTIEIGVSSTAGGGYDTHARLLAHHMPRYIPGHPTMVVKNVDGASGLRLANMLYNTAPKDGTVFGTIYRSTSFDPLFGNNAPTLTPRSSPGSAAPATRFRSALLGTRAASRASTTCSHAS
jgi:tripartite-type tricarboxylate transporter receptor subunit TctC